MNWVKIKQHDWDKLKPETPEYSKKKTYMLSSNDIMKVTNYRRKKEQEKKLLMEEEARLKRDMV